MPKQYMGRDFMDVKILYNESMKTRDGVTLYADVYRPNNDIPYPAIVCRTPYLKDADGLHTGYFKLLRMASSGYNIVVQDCRGTGYSEGICDPAGHHNLSFRVFPCFSRLSWRRTLGLQVASDRAARGQ